MRYVSTYGLSLATKETWLERVAHGRHNPKPPEYWLTLQENQEGRNRRTAAIIWSRNYSSARKMAIWSQAPDEDFLALGYAAE